MSKVEKLAELEGFNSSIEMLEEVGMDSIVPGICTNKNCDYTTSVEPDQYEGYCEECGTNTVKSCLALLGII